MNAELLFALDLGFCIGLVTLLDVLGAWAILAALGEGGKVGKVGIMHNLGKQPLFLRKAGPTWLELGFLPGSYLQKRDAEMELYDSVFANGTGDAPQNDAPLKEFRTLEDLQQAGREEASAAFTQRPETEPTDTYSVPTSWKLISYGWNILLLGLVLLLCYEGEELGKGLAEFISLIPITLGQLFWIGETEAWVATFKAAAPLAHPVLWGVVWIGMIMALNGLPMVLASFVRSGSLVNKVLSWLTMVLGMLVLVHIVMSAAALTDHFWGGLVLYVLGAFACQFVLYWVVLYGVRALVKKAA